MIPKPSEKRLVLVLDTNVCLDLFVFQDRRWDKLLAALTDGRCSAITKTSCREEWLAVLHYPQLPINDDSRPGMIAAFDRLIQWQQPESTSGIKLPLCSDPDDQQFLELARDGQASHLITKDKALLKCARKVANMGLFQIMTPEVFLASVDF